VTHGWTLDEKGQPMSKSLGNAILPAEICEKWGADILRAWVTWQDYTADVSLGPSLLSQLTEAYRKVRNTFRYALGNLFDFHPDRDSLPDEHLLEMDRWMLARTAQLVADCRRFYDDYDFHRVFHALHDFCVVDLSATYFDILKDRLYTFAPRSRARRSAQTAVYRIAGALLRLTAPILVFTAEEVWKYLPRRAGDPDSVHMALFPAAKELGAPLDEKRTAAWDKLLQLRTKALKSLEEARNAKIIASSLEAQITLRAPSPATVLREYEAVLRELLIVSQVKLVLGPIDPLNLQDELEISSVDVKVEPAVGTKCERCWNYSSRVGEDTRYPTVCERCSAALAEIERERAVPTGRDAGT
jgi:isoleucyl-tRNA synthetase